MLFKGHNCLFIHINKTGGGSISRALKDGRRSPSFDTIHWRLRRYVRDHSEEIRDCFKFTFVRNPWDKVLSQYFFRQGPQFGLQTSTSTGPSKSTSVLSCSPVRTEVG